MKQLFAITIVGLVIILIGAGVGYYKYSVRTADEQFSLSSTPNSQVVADAQLQPVTSSNTTDWQSFTSQELRVSFKYPPNYALSTHTLSDPDDNQIIALSYPVTFGLSRGISIKLNNESLAEVIAELSKQPGVASEGTTLFTGTMWHKFSYDPKNDPTATDQDQSIEYRAEKNGKSYSISADMSETDQLSQEEVRENLNAFMGNFSFAD